MTRLPLRQLAWLLRPVGSPKRGISAVAVYAHPDDNGHFRLRAAMDQGYEGVACLDDTARLAALYLRLSDSQEHRRYLASAMQCLRFVKYMQEPSGAFINFISDWTGERNLSGVTSAAGGEWWASRALTAMAIAYAGDEDPEWRYRLLLGADALAPTTADLAARGQAILAMALLWMTGGDRAARARMVRWAEDLQAQADVDGAISHVRALRDLSLWGRTQELALAVTGRLCSRPDLVAAAVRSAARTVVPAAKGGFADRPHLVPYDVVSTGHALAGVGRLSGQVPLRRLSSAAIQWLLGRNAARRSLINWSKGCVYDGIDCGAVNVNSGAESNIEGVGALAGFAGLWPEFERLAPST